MNIIDTRAKGNFEFVGMSSIKNIPLFKLVPIEYSFEDKPFKILFSKVVQLLKISKI